MRDKTLRKRTSKGCFSSGVHSYKISNIIYDNCAGNYVTEMDFLLSAFSLYEKGTMPFKGNLGDQPNKVIELFNIIQNIRNNHDG